MVSKNTRKNEKTKKIKRNKNLQERGITLIALVVTIIVLLILAGISIQMLMGNNGILKKVAEVASKTDIAEYKEELDLLGVDLLIDETVGGKSSTFMEKYKAKIEEEFPNAEVTEEDNSLRVETEEGYVFRVTEDGAEYVGEGDEATEPSKSEMPPLEKGTVLYADVDGNDSNNPDAVIYADLSVARSGKWNPKGDTSYDEGGTYSYAKKTGTFKQYKVVNESYTGAFGEGKVIAPISGTSGIERYYAMALSDVGSSQYYWYYSAISETIPSYSDVAPTGFGKGITNTKTMIDAWKSETYGTQNGGGSSYPDIWGLTDITSKYDSTPKWYVPSREEWAAFGDHFSITKSDFNTKYKLNAYYLSSSLHDESYAWGVSFYGGYMTWTDSSNAHHVRLGVTF